MTQNQLSNATKFRRIVSSRTANTINLFNLSALKERTLTKETKFNFFKDCVAEYKLILAEGQPFYPLKVSQFIVDYDNSKLYYFNVLYEGMYCHFEFAINSNSKAGNELVAHKLKDNNQIQKISSNMLLTDIGLCLGKQQDILGVWQILFKFKNQGI